MSDLAELRRLARQATQVDAEDWYDAERPRGYRIIGTDLRLIAALSPDVVLRLIEAAELGAAAGRLVDEVIFDLPIGNDVTYSRGYSAGTAAARESLRAALKEGVRDV